METKLDKPKMDLLDTDFQEKIKSSKLNITEIIFSNNVEKMSNEALLERLIVVLNCLDVVERINS